MTAAAVAIRARAERLTLAVSQDVLALVALGVLALGLVAITWGTWGDLDSDSGYDVVAGMRLADGELPYRDFTYFYGPLSAGVSALGALVGGDGFGPAVAIGLLLTAAIVSASYALGRSLLSPLGAFLAAVITLAVAFIPNNYSYVLPHTHAATLGTLLLLVFLLGIVRYAQAPSAWSLLASGVAFGLMTLTKPEVTIAALATASLWIVLRAVARMPWHREALLLAAPAVAIPALVYGGLLTVMSLDRLVFENLYPVDELRAGGDVMLGGRMPNSFHDLSVIVRDAAMYVAGAAFIVGLGLALARGGRLRRLALAVVGTGATLAVFGAFANPEALRHGFYYVYGGIPVLAAIALALLLRRFLKRQGAWTAEQQALVVCATALTVVAFTAGNGFFLHAPRPQMAVYYAPLIAIFLARLHLVALARRPEIRALGVAWLAFLAAAGTGLTIMDARAETVTVRGPGGALAETPDEGALYSSALGWIERTTKPGDPIFVSPIMTGLNVLSGRPSPLRELSMLPGALPTVDDERAAIARLDRAGVRLAVTDRREWPGYGHTHFGGSFQRIVSGWLERNFTHAATLRAEGAKGERTLDVWTRRIP
jgi:Dolichyl-phosphate-mannose-protein mannosyltransferase